MSIQNRTIRIGVVGLAHGAGHAATLRETEGFELVALCDVNPQSLSAVGDRTGVPAALRFTDYAAMLDGATLDAVVIAAPTPLHTEMALPALRRGLHVLMEKALADSLDSAQRIADAVDAAGTVFQVGYELRSSPLYQRVRQTVASGVLGETAFAWMTQFRSPAKSEWRRDRRIGGMFFDCCIHQVDAMTMWLDSDFHRCYAMGAPLGACGPSDAVPDTVAACIEFANGVRATVGFTQTTEVKTVNETLFGIVGTTGKLEGNPWDPEHAGSLDIYTDGGLFRNHVIVTGELTSTGHLGFREQHARFRDTILHGAPNVCSVEDALRTQRLMAALDIAIREDRPVLRSEFA